MPAAQPYLDECGGRSLKGLIYDTDDDRYTHSHAVKNGKRYRYCASLRVIKDAEDTSSMPERLPAADIEGLVIRKLKSFLTSVDSITTELGSEEGYETQRMAVAAKRLAEPWN